MIRIRRLLVLHHCKFDPGRFCFSRCFPLVSGKTYGRAVSRLCCQFGGRVHLQKRRSPEHQSGICAAFRWLYNLSPVSAATVVAREEEVGLVGIMSWLFLFKQLLGMPADAASMSSRRNGVTVIGLFRISGTYAPFYKGTSWYATQDPSTRSLYFLNSW